MPTVNPRTNVTLSPSLDLLVVRLAAMQQVSKSQVLRELLEAAEPALQRAVALMEAAAKSKGAVLDGLARSLEQAQDQVEAQLAAHLTGMDAATADLVARAEAVRGRRPRTGVSQATAGASGPAVGGSTPVPVTRGSGVSRVARKGARRGPV